MGSHRNLGRHHVSVLDDHDHVSGVNLVANLHFADEPYARIDLVFDADAAASSFGDRVADLGCVNFGNKSRARRFYRKRLLCQRQNCRRLIAYARVAALFANVLAKCFERCA